MQFLAKIVIRKTGALFLISRRFSEDVRATSGKGIPGTSLIQRASVPQHLEDAEADLPAGRAASANSVGTRH